MAIKFQNNQKTSYLNALAQINNTKGKTFNNVHLLNSQIKDSVNFTGKSEKEVWGNNVPESTKIELKKAVDEIVSGDLTGKKLLGKGADGEVYKISDIPGYPNGIAVKLSHTSEKDPITGQMQRVGIDFSDERKVLSLVPSTISNTQQMVGYMTSGNRYALLTTVVRGNEPDPKTNPLNSKNLGNLLETLFELDKVGTLHRDLKKENILIDKESGDVGLIDFGAAIKVDLDKPNLNEKEHHIPSFMMPSNVRSFEDTCLAPYLNELGKNNPQQARELFTDYLSIKAEKIHEPAVKFLDTYLDENASKLDCEQIEFLNKAKKFEQIQAKLLKNPKPEIVDIELLKMQMTYSSELAYKNEVLLLNPLANITLKMWSLINAKKLEGKVNQLQSKPNTTEMKDYLDAQKDISKFRQTKVIDWTKGLFGWLMNCGEKDLKQSDSNEKSVQDQFMKKGLNNFEIPDMAGNLSVTAV